MIEIATEQNTKEFYDLWRICFEDSEIFSKWLFQNRFLPEFSTYLQQENHMVCCMQAYPLHITARGQILQGVMLCGVATHPDYRRRGWMGKLFSQTMTFLRERGFVIAVHTPAVLPSYFSFGHFPVAAAKYMTAECIPNIEKKAGIYEIKENFRIVYQCYAAFCQKYSGCISRTMADFLLKIEDYRVDGGRVITYAPKGKIKGYAVFYQTEEVIQAVEVVAEDTESYHEVLEGLFSYGAGLKFSAKLPTDIVVSFPFTTERIVEKGVAGGLHIQNLLKTFGTETGYAIAIEDTIVLENTGVFDLNGEKTDKQPDIKLSAGAATQFLLGYVSLQELEKQGKLMVYHREKMMALDALLPKQNCYIIDEY